MTEEVKDRRSNHRVPADFNAKVTAGDEGFEARVKNVSASGVLLISNTPLAEMTMVRMRLSVPPIAGNTTAYAFEITGAVVRCEETSGSDTPASYELAVFLTNMPREAKLALAEFVASRIGSVDS